MLKPSLFSNENPAILIVGLGNPGIHYLNTRHNVGFLCLDYLSKAFQIPFKPEKKKSILGGKIISNTNLGVILLKPQTYNGLSGDSVLYVASSYQVEVKNIFIIYDDIETEFSKVRFTRKSKEVIFHNGVQHLTDLLPSDDFYKIGIGLGPLPENQEKEDFFLSIFNAERQKTLESTFALVKEKIDNYIETIACKIQSH